MQLRDGRHGIAWWSSHDCVTVVTQLKETVNVSLIGLFAVIIKMFCKTTKKPSTKQKSEEAKQKAKVTPSNPSADNSKADKEPSSPVGSLEALWNAAKASKTKKLKEEDQTQVWIDSKLLRQIELLNVKCGKPAPTKHVVNAILTLFLDEHKKDLQKLK